MTTDRAPPAQDPQKGSRRPLAGRTVLVLGAADPVASSAALHAAARGAAVVAAGPDVPQVILTAGLIAATGAVGRVVEEAAPPLLGAALVRAATAALGPAAGPITDVVIAAALFSTPASAQAATADLVAALPPGTRVHAAEAAPVDGPKAAGRRIADGLLAPPGGPR